MTRGTDTLRARASIRACSDCGTVTIGEQTNGDGGTGDGDSNIGLILLVLAAAAAVVFGGN